VILLIPKRLLVVSIAPTDCRCSKAVIVIVQYLSGKCVLRANGVKWTKGTHFPERYCTDRS
jgi:hypothetical protein